MNQRPMRSVDDLPLYPTPQQASYVIGDNEPPRKQSIPMTNNKPGFRPPAPASNGKYNHLVPNLSYGQGNPSYDAPVPQQYYQQPPPPRQQQQQQSQPQQIPLPQQYQQQHYQQPPRPQVVQPPPQQHHQQQQYAQPPLPQHYEPSHTDQQSIASFNNLRISPQQPYQHNPRVASENMYQPPPAQQPIYKQHSGPSNPGVSHSLPSHSGPSHSIRPQTTRIVSSSSTNSTLHKKPPPSEKPKVKLEQELRQVFEKVDKNNSGRISARELSYALTNFDNTKFRDSTIILMIKLFSTSPSSGSLPSKLLNFDQFVSLWKHLASYKKLFIQADANNSGDISFGEFQKILKEMGYKLNIDLALHLFQKFSYKNLDEFDSGITVGKLKFDSFVELLVYLKKLTDVFKKYDKDKIGVSTIGFSDFLLEVSNLT